MQISGNEDDEELDDDFDDNDNDDNDDDDDGDDDDHDNDDHYSDHDAEADDDYGIEDLMMITTKRISVAFFMTWKCWHKRSTTSAQTCQFQVGAYFLKISTHHSCHYKLLSLAKRTWASVLHKTQISVDNLGKFDAFIYFYNI